MFCQDSQDLECLGKVYQVSLHWGSNRGGKKEEKVGHYSKVGQQATQNGWNALLNVSNNSATLFVEYFIPSSPPINF